MKKRQYCDTRTEAEAASILSGQPGHAADKADKAGWLRRFCGKGMFREIWKNRFVILKDQQLMVCEKEVVNILFLAVSPEDKESWIHVLNVAITRAKNKILDQVTVEEAQLCHLTRDRARIGHGRRPPSRGHLLAAASSSDGTVTLDRIQEEDISAPHGLDGRNPEETPPAWDRVRSEPDGALFPGAAEVSGKSQSLPRGGAAAQQRMRSGWTSGSGKESRTSQKNRCASMDEICSHSDKNRTVPPRLDASTPVDQLHHLISLKVAQTERLLATTRDRPEGRDGKRTQSVEEMRAEAFGLLKDALEALEQARQVLQEVKELGKLHHQLNRS
ncbi:pleckstrin homology domain-containing family O member 1b isoform X2 [Phyllopteryx taeniolatus]|uniref:pleckstrin homology domain-containing family O member 1b isoform X2 n=1 Tax=Phyllopteryx taeniolatus TaxID=161469 RepID=UPI002AD58A9F|nr:pleckstrin homology domain-containing family O member 1b isoform X2 [Phyllopteryx taeniolatus]